MRGAPVMTTRPLLQQEASRAFDRKPGWLDTCPVGVLVEEHMDQVQLVDRIGAKEPPDSQKQSRQAHVSESRRKGASRALGLARAACRLRSPPALRIRCHAVRLRPLPGRRSELAGRHRVRLKLAAVPGAVLESPRLALACRHRKLGEGGRSTILSRNSAPAISPRGLDRKPARRWIEDAPPCLARSTRDSSKNSMSA